MTNIRKDLDLSPRNKSKEPSSERRERSQTHIGPMTDDYIASRKESYSDEPHAFLRTPEGKPIPRPLHYLRDPNDKDSDDVLHQRPCTSEVILDDDSDKVIACLERKVIRHKNRELELREELGCLQSDLQEENKFARDLVEKNRINEQALAALAEVLNDSQQRERELLVTISSLRVKSNELAKNLLDLRSDNDLIEARKAELVARQEITERDALLLMYLKDGDREVYRKFEEVSNLSPAPRGLGNSEREAELLFRFKRVFEGRPEAVREALYRIEQDMEDS